MLTAHHVNAFLVIGVCVAAAAAAFWARRRGRAGGAVSHLLALAQTLLVAQVALGLLLLSDHQRAADHLHYAYGTFALARRALAVAVRAGRAAGATGAGSQARHSSPRRSAFAPT